MSEALIEAVANRFRALGEPARLRILQQLLSGERSVNDLTEATGLSQTNTSKHLATLHAAGFLERRKTGTSVYYAIADPVVHQLCALMCARITAQARAGARAVNAR
jgi:DNA-binding transcriptional ArsR family regulator